MLTQPVSPRTRAARLIRPIRLPTAQALMLDKEACTPQNGPAMLSMSGSSPEAPFRPTFPAGTLTRLAGAHPVRAFPEHVISTNPSKINKSYLIRLSVVNGQEPYGAVIRCAPAKPRPVKHLYRTTLLPSKMLIGLSTRSRFIRAALAQVAAQARRPLLHFPRRHQTVYPFLRSCRSCQPAPYVRH